MAETKAVPRHPKRPEVNPKVLCYYHSDGDVREIIEDLIEIGVDILNPVQPECMDPIAVKEQYGLQVSFWGTIGTQTTMPFGTPEEVRNKTLEMKEKVGKGGGLVLAPTHLLEPEVPLGKYRSVCQGMQGTIMRNIIHKIQT